MSLLKQNEKDANLIVAKVMRVSFFIFTLIYILNVIGIFEVNIVVFGVRYYAPFKSSAPIAGGEFDSHQYLSFPAVSFMRRSMSSG